MAGGGMSFQARAPRIGIKAQTRVVRCGVCKSIDEAGRINAPQSVELALDISLSDTVGVSTSVRPGRGRNRTKGKLEDKVRKPAEDGQKKSPPVRKAPARGRYVDEYARPAR
jgi:hypothetical protein